MTLKPVARVTERAGWDGEPLIEVSVEWTGAPLDRTSGGGYLLPVKRLNLAQRLARAIDAGAAFGNPRIVKDVRGNTYVHVEWLVHPKCMSADLRRLGF